jgi:hypothetical protein
MKVVEDPLGNKVMIPKAILESNGHLVQSGEELDDMSLVIEKPMMLYRMKERDTDLYYLRAIGWHKIMMIGVQRCNDHFEIISFEIDPPAKKISDLHKNAVQLL